MQSRWLARLMWAAGSLSLACLVLSMRRTGGAGGAGDAGGWVGDRGVWLAEAAWLGATAAALGPVVWRAACQATTVSQRRLAIAVLALMTLGHLMGQSRTTFPLPSWRMYTGENHGDPVIVDHIQLVTADQQTISIHPARLYPTLRHFRLPNLLGHLVLHARDVHDASAPRALGPARDDADAAARLNAALRALASAYEARHGDRDGLEIVAIEVRQERLPLSGEEATEEVVWITSRHAKAPAASGREGAP